MKEGCKGDGTCGRKERGECEGECAHEHGANHHHEKIDIKSLGPDAVELANMFEDINGHLVAALQTRKKILEKLHNDCKQQELREKYDAVIGNLHPVLIQFVFGDGQKQ